MRSGYADEYDRCPPDQLRTSLDRERIEPQRRHASRPIPEGFDYGGVRHLRAEAHEQLAKIRPQTLGQAGRVSGNLGRERIALSLTGGRQRTACRTAFGAEKACLIIFSSRGPLTPPPPRWRPTCAARNAASCRFPPSGR
jgi:hypothetical protein